jgi:cytochrome oxidase assembly protein ShyY1
MKRLPLVPTLMVAVMLPVLVALGLWQLQRAEWKEALLARLEANAEAPLADAPRAFSEEDGFRRVTVSCTTTRALGIGGAAPTARGFGGFRHLAWCDRDGDPLIVSLGVGRDPAVRIAQSGPATFTGRLVPHEGDAKFLLVSERAAPGLVPEVAPTTEILPNNHLSYAGQWFGFAAVLALIYAIYLRAHFAKAGAKG